jgi:hypothetical protein
MTIEGWPFESQPGKPAEKILRQLADGILRFVDTWQAGDSEASADTLVALLGLGEGLTPTGDDLVSGIFAAFVWQARLGDMSAADVDYVARRLRDASSRTNTISARLLHNAARGVLYSPAMELGSASLAGDSGSVRIPAERLFSIGHSTGMDLATGILVGCLTDDRRAK